MMRAGYAITLGTPFLGCSNLYGLQLSSVSSYHFILHTWMAAIKVQPCYVSGEPRLMPQASSISNKKGLGHSNQQHHPHLHSKPRGPQTYAFNLRDVQPLSLPSSQSAVSCLTTATLPTLSTHVPALSFLSSHPDFLPHLANLLRVLLIAPAVDPRHGDPVIEIITTHGEGRASLAFHTLLHVCEHLDAGLDGVLPGVFACPRAYFDAVAWPGLKNFAALSDMEGIRRISGPTLPQDAGHGEGLVPIVVFGSTPAAVENALFLLATSLLHAHQRTSTPHPSPNTSGNNPAYGGGHPGSSSDGGFLGGEYTYSLSCGSGSLASSSWDHPPRQSWMDAADNHSMHANGSNYSRRLNNAPGGGGGAPFSHARTYACVEGGQSDPPDESCLRIHCPRETLWDPITLPFLLCHFTMGPLPFPCPRPSEDCMEVEGDAWSVCALCPSSSSSSSSFSSSSFSSSLDTSDGPTATHSSNCLHSAAPPHFNQLGALSSTATPTVSTSSALPRKLPPQRSVQQLHDAITSRATQMQSLATLVYTWPSQPRHSLMVPQPSSATAACLDPLSAQGLVPMGRWGGGDGLYRALGLALFGTQAEPPVQELRVLAGDAMEADSVYRQGAMGLVLLQQSRGSEEPAQRPASLEEYCSEVRRMGGVSGGDAALRALSRALSIRISVYTPLHPSPAPCPPACPLPASPSSAGHKRRHHDGPDFFNPNFNCNSSPDSRLSILFATTPGDARSEREVLLMRSEGHYHLLAPTHPTPVASVAGA